MKRFSRLQTRLVLGFLAVTLLPLGLTLWVGIELLNRSLDLSPVPQFDEMTKSYQQLGREFYQHQRERLREDVAHGYAKPRIWDLTGQKNWPASVAEFWDSADTDHFELSGETGDQLNLLVRRPEGVYVYARDLAPIGMNELARQYTRARSTIEHAQARDFRRGFITTLLVVAGGVWFAGLMALAYFARLLGKPVHDLTKAMQAVAAGDLSKRVELDRTDEIGAAIRAFNDMAGQLQQSREKLIHVTRLASWQALARKTAHEVKNSLTPIRLTMEEIIARQDGSDPFLSQAAQIVIDEVTSLERRVRAFSEFASEPPVQPAPVDVNAAVEERIALLRSANPAVRYEVHLAPSRPYAMADADLLRGLLTNLLENAAHAAGPGGTVLARTLHDDEQVLIEIHDSGPGLSAQAQSTVFEPTISFKKGGMGLGLSIAKKSAVLCGGDIALIESEIGGAGFRVHLPGAPFGTPTRSRELVEMNRGAA